jgi:hypothetical protein
MSFVPITEKPRLNKGFVAVFAVCVFNGLIVETSQDALGTLKWRCA